MSGQEAPLIEVRNYSFAYPREADEGAADAVRAADKGDAPAEGGATGEACAYGGLSGSDGLGGEPVLRDLSFCVDSGDFCLVVGPTGCGKSTLLRSLAPALAPAGTRSGSIRVCGIDVVRPCCQGDSSVASLPQNDGEIEAQPAEVQGSCSSLNTDYDRQAAAERIGFVAQDPDAQIVCDTVYHELAFTLENLGTPPDAMRRRVAEVAHFFGIEPWVGRTCAELSGGQKQIVNLASALAACPDLLLLDEPTAQLDASSRERFVSLVGRVNRELGITVLAATHAPELFEHLATGTLELGALPPLAPPPCHSGGRTHAGDEEPRPSQSEPAIALKGVYLRFEREAPWVLRGLDMTVQQGSVHAVLGGNGCGKTTALRCMAGVLHPQRGRVENVLAKRQAYLPQDPKALFTCDSISAELREWQERCGYSNDTIAEVCERFGLSGFDNRHPYDLSGGQGQKLALAKLLLTDPALLLLDEPTKGLDAASAAELATIVRGLTEEGRTVVLVTHDLDFAVLVADEATMLFDGEAACTEPAADFFENNLVYRPSSKSRLFGARAFV